jgi:Mg-chelatase subunit ChlD
MSNARRWRLILGEPAKDACNFDLSVVDRGMDKALSELYEEGHQRAGLGASKVNISRWLGDIRSYFPTPVIQLLQKDAIERRNLKQLLLEPETLATIEVDVHLVATLLSLAQLIPEKTKSTARIVVRKLVEQIEAQLRLKQAVSGALDRASRTRHPKFQDIDWPRTIRRNLKNWLPELPANHTDATGEPRGALLISEVTGIPRKTRSLKDIILCVDQSGSMMTSVVYASIFAATLASIRAVSTRLVLFDTAIVDLTPMLADPVDVLFGTQLGGGTDIAQALQYCAGLVTRPEHTTFVLISDLFEGGDQPRMRATAAELVSKGVNVIVLLALNDEGAPAFDAGNANYFASLGCATFACTPDQFPEVIGVALARGDVHQWAAKAGIAVRRGWAEQAG